MTLTFCVVDNVGKLLGITLGVLLRKAQTE